MDQHNHTQQPPTTPSTSHAASAPSIAASEPQQILSHAEMNTAHEQGLVQPLAQTVGYVVTYRGAWWICYEGGWIRADPELAAALDAEAERITAQDAIIARNAAIRAAVEPSPQD